MRDMDAGVPCTVAVVVHCEKSKSVQEGPIRGDVGEGGAGGGLESPKTPLSIVVVGTMLPLSGWVGHSIDHEDATLQLSDYLVPCLSACENRGSKLSLGLAQVLLES